MTASGDDSSAESAESADPSESVDGEESLVGVDENETSDLDDRSKSGEDDREPSTGDDRSQTFTLGSTEPEDDTGGDSTMDDDGSQS